MKSNYGMWRCGIFTPLHLSPFPPNFHQIICIKYIARPFGLASLRKAALECDLSGEVNYGVFVSAYKININQLYAKHFAQSRFYVTNNKCKMRP